MNKVAIVTEASNEVGAEICRQLCCHQVVVVGLTPQLDQLNVLGEEIREHQENAQFHAVQCDSENEEEVQSVLDYVNAELGGVDVLVNVATTSPVEYGLLLEEEEEDDEESESIPAPVNVLSKKVHQSIVERGTRGHIIIVFYVAEDCKDKDRCSAGIWPIGRDLCRFSQPKIRWSKISAMNVKVDQLKKEEEGVEREDDEVEKEVDVEQRLFIGPKDIADTVSYCLSTPVHVQIKDIQLGATGGEF